MPRGSFRDFLRFLIPSVRQRLRTRISDFRFDTWPALKLRAQSRIYAAILKHQRDRRSRVGASRFLVLDANGKRRLKDGPISRMLNYKDGSKRAKLAGYLQQAKKMGQEYQARRVGAEEYPDMPGAYPGVKISRNGDDELIIFPSYARPHVKSSNRHMQDLQREGLSEEEYWRSEWKLYEDKHATVDVDIRGWIYTNLKGPMNRRNRLLLTVARQLSGIPAPDSSAGYGANSIADPNSHTARHEQELAEKEIRRIERRGQEESERAQQGAYSEMPDGDDSVHEEERHRSGSEVVEDALSKRESWAQPSDFTPEELEKANTHLLTRLRPFLTTPSINTALTIFYYNGETSISRTTTTNEYGHFNFRAALDFIPTHVRVLAGENLSAMEQVNLSESSGISLISDIDDTVKHSGITAGAKEIFRNTFIRELNDLTVDGVRQWYQKMASLGVKMHYVSNSPWQLYPVLAEYFTVAGLPKGSFHLKQYTGMLQGIFEPVAERKKGSLERILHDFPDRRFILVGDSGEADLEVYTDVALANPKRIIGVFIRDVTTPKYQGLGFFNSSQRPSTYSSSSDPSMRVSSSGAFSSTPPRAAQRRPLRPPLPPRPKSFAQGKQEEEEDLIDLSDDFEPSPPDRSSTEPMKSPLNRSVTANTSFSANLPLRSTPSGQSGTGRKAPPPPPPKPRQLAGQPPANDSSYTGMVVNKLSSIYNNAAAQVSTANSNDGPSSRTASPGPGSGPRFGEGSLAFINDGNRTNDRPAPPLPPRRGDPAASAGSSSLGSSRGYASGTTTPPGPNRREETWMRRWLRAKEMLADRGIVLKAWRVGSDVMDDAVRLIEKAQREGRS